MYMSVVISVIKQPKKTNLDVIISVTTPAVVLCGETNMHVHFCPMMKHYKKVNMILWRGFFCMRFINSQNHRHNKIVYLQCFINANVGISNAEEGKGYK